MTLKPGNEQPLQLSIREIKNLQPNIEGWLQKTISAIETALSKQPPNVAEALDQINNFQAAITDVSSNNPHFNQAPANEAIRILRAWVSRYETVNKQDPSTTNESVKRFLISGREAEVPIALLNKLEVYEGEAMVFSDLRHKPLEEAIRRDVWDGLISVGGVKGDELNVYLAQAKNDTYVQTVQYNDGWYLGYTIFDKNKKRRLHKIFVLNSQQYQELTRKVG